MAISFQEWYQQYAQRPGATPIAPNVLSALAANVTNPSYEIGFGNLLTQLGQIGTGYNNARNTAAQNTRSAAYNAGLSDETQVSEAGRTAGNAVLGTKDAVTYKVKMGPDGRAYRQAYLNTGANAAARSWGGSDNAANQWSAKQALNMQKSKLLNDFTTGQNQSVIDQGTDEAGKIGEIATNISDYGQWKINNTPNSPSGLAAPAAAAAPAPAAPAAKAAPKNGVIWHGKANPNRAQLQRIADQYGPGRSFEVKTRGGGLGYVAVLV